MDSMNVYYEDVKVKEVQKFMGIARKVFNVITFLIVSSLAIYYYLAYSDLVSQNQQYLAEIKNLQETSQSLYNNNEKAKLIIGDYDGLTNKLVAEIKRLVIYQKNLETKIKKMEGKK